MRGCVRALTPAAVCPLPPQTRLQASVGTYADTLRRAAEGLVAASDEAAVEAGVEEVR